MLKEYGYEKSKHFIRDVREPNYSDEWKKSWFAIKIDGVCIGIYNADNENGWGIGDTEYTLQEVKVPVEIDVHTDPYYYNLDGDDLVNIDLAEMQRKIEKELKDLEDTSQRFEQVVAKKAEQRVIVRGKTSEAKERLNKLKEAARDVGNR